MRLFSLFFLFLCAAFCFADEVDRRVLNNGQLILEDIPEIPREVRDELFRFQDIRAAAFRAWAMGGKSIYVSTGFGSVDSLHKIDRPLGARRQLTFFREPLGEVSRRPGHPQLLFTRDVGGSEFSQLFLMDTEGGEARMLTDGESLNGEALWDRRGARLAYQSTRRDGAANDIWIMNPDDPEKAAIALESQDGSFWAPTEFSQSGGALLVRNYQSVEDSRAHLVDLDSGAVTRLAGGEQQPSVNQPVAFDEDNNGFWMITDQGSEFRRLAWQSLQPGSRPEIIATGIPWDVNDAVISNNRKQIAFVANEDGVSRLYLLNTRTREYRVVDELPMGRISGLSFNPDDRSLGMTLNSPRSPSDAYVLDLRRKPLRFGRFTRWTESEIGGLDATRFVAPKLVHYSTFDHREIPAWIHKPAGGGPHPVIIRVHGGPESQARPTFSTTWQMWVATLGVAVIQPNVRGSAGYGKSFIGLDNGVNREDAVKDIGALLDWIETQPDLDASRVAIYGGSYGGYMALASAVHYGSRLRAVVDNVGISNFVTFLENTQDYRRDRRRKEYGDERDPEMRAHLENISPLTNADRIDVPLFVIQGANDPRVPASEADQLVASLREQGRAVWYMNALNEGHGYRKRENRDIMQQAMVMFFRQYLADETGQD
jgi:dipeptidyl aminopeptidase/acylaminoacyl peptidase